MSGSDDLVKRARSEASFLRGEHPGTADRASLYMKLADRIETLEKVADAARAEKGPEALLYLFFDRIGELEKEVKTLKEFISAIEAGNAIVEHDKEPTP